MPEAGATVSRVNPLDDPAWETGLEAWPEATFFHGAAWARVLNAAYGYAPCYVRVSDPKGVRSLMPLFEVDSALTGRRGVSLPFTDECEPLARDAADFKTAFEAALRHARDRKWKYLEIRGGTGFQAGVPASTSYYGHHLELNGDEASQIERVEPSVKRAVRKAEQSGLTIEFANDVGSVETFYALLCKTRRRLGVPPQPLSFFREIHRHVLARDQGRIVLARLKGIPIAGAVFFHAKSAAIYKFGASNDRFQHLRANNLVMWEAIKKLRAEGFKTLDFGRTTLTNQGLRRFKSGWGTIERTINYLRYDLRREAFVKVTDGSSGWHSGVFRMLPSPLSRLIGVALYKHIA